MSAPPLLLFDLGGVLIANSTFERLNRLLPGPLDDGAMRSKWLHSTAVSRYERGEIPPGAFAAAFVEEWGLRLSPDDFLREHYSWPSGPYPGALETIRALRKRHRVACLSNCSVLHWEKFSGFMGEFDFALSSHLLGAMKPDDEAYRRAFAACGVMAEEVRFFDDTLVNVEAARRLGARAHHVVGFDELTRTLAAEGLLPG